MADDTHLTTTVRVNLYLGKTGTAALVTDLITLIDGFIQNYCGHNFISAPYTSEKYNGDGTDTLLLKQYPIITVTSIYIDNTLLSSTCYDDTTNKVSGLYLNQGKIVLIDGSTFTTGTQNIWITYNAGYATIPADISLIATQMICELYNNPTGVTSERIGQYSVSYGSIAEGKISPRYAAILDKYKKRW